MAGASVVGGLLSKNKQEQTPQETPEQLAARKAMLEYARTGKFGGFTAGEDIGLGYGDWGVTGTETQGLSAIQDLLNTSDEALEKQSSGYRGLMQRRIRESGDAFKRGMGSMVGGLYSTSTVRGLGDIEARGNETISAELGNLANAALDRKLSAAGAAMQYGGLARNLNNASVAERNQELLRRRQELQLPIQALSGIAGSGSVPYGVNSVQTSPYQNLLNMAGQIGGNYIGNELYMKQYRRYFSNQTPNPEVPYTAGTSGGIYGPE